MVRHSAYVMVKKILSVLAVTLIQFITQTSVVAKQELNYVPDGRGCVCNILQLRGCELITDFK